MRNKRTHETAAPSNLPRVLVVDDEEVIGYLIKRVVKQLGYSVEWVTNCDTALSLIRQNHFHAILSDYKMPRMTGDQFYWQLAEIDPALLKRLVFITGDTVNSNTLRFLKLNSIPFLSKPFELQELEGVIQAIVNGKPQ